MNSFFDFLTVIAPVAIAVGALQNGGKNLCHPVLACLRGAQKKVGMSDLVFRDLLFQFRQLLLVTDGVPIVL